MLFNAPDKEEVEVSGRLWRFGTFEFDESSRKLRADGQPIDLEAKPLEVLSQLLLHAGEVVTKDELLEAVWPDTTVVDGSLATAVSKLRKALGDDQQAIVLTVPRVGYRLGVPAQAKRLPRPAFSELGFKLGDQVPGRDQWQLSRRLDLSESSEVWLAEHPKTHEMRVFKFTADGVRLKGLKREATVSRFLKESLGDRPDFVRVLEWNFDNPPFYLESEYGGPNLAEWAESQGGLDKVPVETRIKLLIAAAEAVAVAHGLGVLHKDLKPGNILIAAKNPGDWQIRVADFGSASLMEPSRLSALGITNLGFTRSEAASDTALTGTVLYMAPEVLAGQSPTASADVYALGVLLYQLVACDFRKPLSPGWEAEVADPLLREDIASAASGDPARRLNSAAVLAERLRTLDRRRVEHSELESARQRALAAEQRIERARTRRPWAIAAMLVLAAGLAAVLTLYRQASAESDRANRQTAITASVNRFLTNDLLGRTNPFQSGKSDETLTEAVKHATPKIDRQFQGAPEVAARLHQSIARALDNRTDYADARPEYARAVTLFEQTGGALSEDAIVAELQLAAAEARSYQKDSLARAKSILADQEARIAKIAKPSDEVGVWLTYARGMIGLIDNNIESANKNFAEAYQRSSKLAAFDEPTRLIFKQRLAFTYIRLGEGAKAEQLFRELIDAFSRTDGPDSPNVLRVRLNLAQAFMVQQKHKEAIEETTRLYPLYVAKLGEDHELSMQLLTTRAESEGALGMYADSIRDDQKIYGLAVRKQGAESFFAIATLSDTALAECRAGRFEEGVTNARKAYDASVKGFGARAGLTGGAAHTLADCLIEVGRLDEASILLGAIDTAAVGQLTGSKDWFGAVEFSQAEIAFRRRDYDSARKHLAIATPILSRSDAEPYQQQAVRKLTAALEQVHPH